MRKSQDIALRSRPHALAALEILKNLSGDTSIEEVYASPLLERREVKKICLVVVTSDKGLCGSFNSNVFRKAHEFLNAQAMPVDIVAVGKKGKDFLKKRGRSIIHELSGIGDFVHPSQTKPLADHLTDIFASGQYDEVYTIYTNFISVLKQEVVIEKLLPFSKDEIKRRIEEITPQRGRYSDMPLVLGATSDENRSYIFEPSPQEALDTLLPLLLEIAVYHVILEANASEHSARMVAMKNASENASELIRSLTLSYNKARQAQITKELIEINAGAAALT